MWSYTSYPRMIHVTFFCFCLSAGFTLSSSLWILDKHLDCSQPGLDNCKVMPDNCSEKRMVVQLAPTGPEWCPHHVGVGTDKHLKFPIMNVTWKLKSDASVLSLNGSEINIVDESTNQSMCVQFSYNICCQLKPNNQSHNSERWMFHLDGVVVEPGHTYMVSVVNIPEPEGGDYRIRKQITIPVVTGCNDSRIRTAQICLENGSLWEPNITTAMSVDKKQEKLYIVLGFEAARYSERYLVSIQSQVFHYSKNVSKENGTSLNVTFEFAFWQITQCEMLFTVQPFFIRCKHDCRRHEEKINYCFYGPRTIFIKAVVGLLVFEGCLFYLLWRASHKGSVNTSSSVAKDQPQGVQVQERKRVLIIYSLDHPLYRNIVLKLSGFLATRCSTEVVLDLLDSARLGVLGSIQWLDCHIKEIENSSDKILILCSPGVQAKWRAMCGDKKVFLREDVLSPVGDMLTPALSLTVPQFIRSASFEKYIVAYFDDVCSEDDVPSPFNITVRYKLMKQFEELFFRILDTEKHEPGRMNHIAGLSENEYHQCPSGRALRDAIEAFHTYQLKHPQWFEDELLESSDLEVVEPSAEIYDSATTNLITYSVPEFTQVICHVKTHEGDFTADKTGLYMTE